MDNNNNNSAYVKWVSYEICAIKLFARVKRVRNFRRQFISSRPREDTCNVAECHFRELCRLVKLPQYASAFNCLTARIHVRLKEGKAVEAYEPVHATATTGTFKISDLLIPCRYRGRREHDDGCPHVSRKHENPSIVNPMDDFLVPRPLSR